MSEEDNCESKEDQSPGIFSWRELITSDTEGSAKFYSDLLGWTKETMDMGGGNAYTMFMNGDQPVAGMIQLTLENRIASFWPRQGRKPSPINVPTFYDSS